MARPLRDIEPGYFHITSHSVRDTALFRDELDRLRFLRELVAAVAKAQWTCVAYCLMTTHFHLLLNVEHGALPVGMQALNFRYACAFNARHGTRGHVFERRYSADRVDSERYLLRAYRYIARNPVEARMCSRPQEWPWSSYAATVGLAEPCTFVDAGCVLDRRGTSYEFAVARLRELVEES